MKSLLEQLSDAPTGFKFDDRTDPNGLRHVDFAIWTKMADGWWQSEIDPYATFSSQDLAEAYPRGKLMKGKVVTESTKIEPAAGVGTTLPHEPTLAEVVAHLKSEGWHGIAERVERHFNPPKQQTLRVVFEIPVTGMHPLGDTIRDASDWFEGNFPESGSLFDLNDTFEDINITAEVEEN